MSVTMGGGAVDVPLRMIGQGYYEHLENLCRRVGVPTTKATVDCSFRLGDGTTLRYSTSRWRNALEVVARWRDAWALDGALRTADAGGTWAAGQEEADSPSLQRGCSRSDLRATRIHAVSAPREMIARRNLSQNEWKATEIRGFHKLADVLPFSCQGGPTGEKPRA